MPGPRIVKCKGCGAQAPSPCPFCGTIDISERQRQLDAHVASVQAWDVPRYYLRRGRINSGPFTARQIVDVAKRGEHWAEVSDNGAPFVMIAAGPFAQYLPREESSLKWLWILIGVAVLLVALFFCGTCAIGMAGSVSG